MAHLHGDRRLLGSGQAPDHDLLLCVVDLSPDGWRRAAQRGISFASYLDALTVFLHAHVLASKNNELAVVVCFGRIGGAAVGGGGGDAELLYPGPGVRVEEAGVPDVSSIVEAVRTRARQVETEQEEDLAAAAEVAGEDAEPLPVEEEDEHGQLHQRAPLSLATAVSLGLCYINRRESEVHAHVGTPHHGGRRGRRSDNAGTVLALVDAEDGDGEDSAGGVHLTGLARLPETNVLQSRLWVTSVTPDLSSHYNAMMNCLFSAQKLGVILDSTSESWTMACECGTRSLERMVSSARGRIPGARGEPRMVCVLPALVMPYAKTSVFLPRTTWWTSGRMVRVKTSSCVASGPNTREKENSLAPRLVTREMCEHEGG